MEMACHLNKRLDCYSQATRCELDVAGGGSADYAVNRRGSARQAAGNGTHPPFHGTIQSSSGGRP